MATYSATKTATQSESNFSLVIDFDKKALTSSVLKCQALHKSLDKWLAHPIFQSHFEPMWSDMAAKSIYQLTWGVLSQKNVAQHKYRALSANINKNMPLNLEGLLAQQALYLQYPQAEETFGVRKNEKPSRLARMAGITPCASADVKNSTQTCLDQIDALPSKQLSPIFKALITIFYLFELQPFGAIQTAINFTALYQVLCKQGFGVIADFIVRFYAENEEQLVEIYAACYHAKHLKKHQQPWFEFFVHAWESALKQAQNDIEAFCMKACFASHAQSLFETKKLNERQLSLLQQLMADENVRDKKTLQYSVWYRAMYRGLTKRTQERDLQILFQAGFLVGVDKQKFVLCDGL